MIPREITFTDAGRCPECGHTHTSNDFDAICIGCPCDWRPGDGPNDHRCIGCNTPASRCVGLRASGEAGCCPNCQHRPEALRGR